MKVVHGFGGPTAVTFRIPPVPKGPTVVTAINPGGRSGSIPFTVLNQRPVADAGSDQTVQVSTVVQLDGSRSFDRHGDSLTHSGAFVSRPAGTGSPILPAFSRRRGR